MLELTIFNGCVNFNSTEKLCQTPIRSSQLKAVDNNDIV